MAKDNTLIYAGAAVVIVVAAYFLLTGTSGGPLAGHMTENPRKGAAPLTVALGATVTGGTGPYTYSWSTGDGGSGSKKNLSYTYQSAGTYSPMCTVVDSSATPATITLSSDKAGSPVIITVS